MKICSKCKETKEYSFFSVDRRKKDGYMSHCKSCKKEYYLENKKYIDSLNLENYYKNKESRSNQKKRIL